MDDHDLPFQWDMKATVYGLVWWALGIGAVCLLAWIATQPAQ